eukprot:gene40927-50637_t
MSADVFCRCDTTTDQLIDLTIDELDIIDQLPHHVPISEGHGWNLEELLESIWEYTKMIKIYTKVRVRVGCIPDYGAPVVLHDSAPSIEDFCFKLHKQLM